MKQPLSDSIENYLGWRASQDFSKGTIRNERSTLTRFLAVVGNIGVHQIRDRHVTKFFEVAGQGRAAGSVRNDHQRLKVFFEWCRHTRRMDVDVDPLYGRRAPKKRHRERHRIPVTRFGELLDTAGDSDPRNRALVALLLYTLARDKEVSDLRVGDLDLDRGYVRVRVHKSRLEDDLPVSAELDREMRLWLTTYTESVGLLQDHYYLVPARSWAGTQGEHGRFESRHFIYRPQMPLNNMAKIIKPFLAAVDVPTVDQYGNNSGEGAHTIRRSGARALFDTLSSPGGYDQPLRVVQSMLHHRTQATTEIYLGITADRRTRDELLRGQNMYPDLRGTVIPLAR